MGLTGCSSLPSSCAPAAAADVAASPSPLLPLLPPDASANLSRHADPREELLWWDCTRWASVGLFGLEDWCLEEDDSSFSRPTPEPLPAALPQSWASFASGSTCEEEKSRSGCEEEITRSRATFSFRFIFLNIQPPRSFFSSGSLEPSLGLSSGLALAWNCFHIVFCCWDEELSWSPPSLRSIPASARSSRQACHADGQGCSSADKLTLFTRYTPRKTREQHEHKPSTCLTSPPLACRGRPAPLHGDILNSRRWQTTAGPASTFNEPRCGTRLGLPL